MVSFLLEKKKLHKAEFMVREKKTTENIHLQMTDTW